MRIESRTAKRFLREITVLGAYVVGGVGLLHAKVKLSDLPGVVGLVVAITIVLFVLKSIVWPRDR